MRRTAADHTRIVSSLLPLANIARLRFLSPPCAIMPPFPACRLCWCCAPALAGRPGRRPLSHSHPAIPSVLSRRLGLVQVVPHRPKSYLRDGFFDAVAQLGGQTVRRSIHPFVSVYMLIICSVLSFLVILFHGKSNSEYYYEYYRSQG